MLRLTLVGWAQNIKVKYMNDLLEKQLYMGIVAVLKDDKLYYESRIGKKGEYNHFKEGGHEALLRYIDQMAPLILANEREKLDARAKQMVMEELKR